MPTTGGWPLDTPQPASPPDTWRSTWRPRWSGACECGHERSRLGRRDRHRWGGLRRPLPPRRIRVLRGGARLSLRHPGDQRFGRARARPADRARAQRQRGAAGWHGGGRLLHHVLHVDARDPADGGGTRARQGRRQHHREPRARRGRRGARQADRNAPVNEDCLKLTSYFGERQRAGGEVAADALLDLYGRHEIATSILVRGTEGFGAKQRLRTDRSLSLSDDLPLIAIAVDARSRVEAVFDEARRLTGTGLVTLERARLLAGDITPMVLPGGPDDATKLTVYLGRQERAYRVPAFIAVC